MTPIKNGFRSGRAQPQGSGSHSRESIRKRRPSTVTPYSHQKQPGFGNDDALRRNRAASAIPFRQNTTDPQGFLDASSPWTSTNSNNDRNNNNNINLNGEQLTLSQMNHEVGEFEDELDREDGNYMEEEDDRVPHAQVMHNTTENGTEIRQGSEGISDGLSRHVGNDTDSADLDQAVKECQEMYSRVEAYLIGSFRKVTSSSSLVEDVSSACDHLCRGILVSVTNQATAAKAPINPLKQLRDASRDLDRQLDVIKTLK